MTGLDDSFTENTFGDLSYTFLEPVPNYLTCIICYGLLKDAVATECCGKMFCYEHSSRTDRVCPACRHTPLAVARNKGIDSIVKDLKVFCLHREEGCQWNGHLCFEPRHRIGTCEFEVISCMKGCGADMQRRLLETHLLDDCPRREVKCEFCEVIVTVAELESHQESCPDYPVGCPHGCELTVPRKKVEEHSTVCPDLLVPCPFAGAGCNQRVKNKDLDDHVQATVVEHLSLISAQNIALQKKLTTVIDDRETSKQVQRNLHSDLRRVSAENVSLRAKLEGLERDYAAMKMEKLNIRDELRLVKQKCAGLNRDLHTIGSFWRKHLAEASATQSATLPMIYRHSGFERDMENGKASYTPSFYTGDRGYKLCLTVFPDGLFVDDWMSVTIVVLPGAHDNALQWPMEGSLNVEVLNQQGDYGHFSKEINFAPFPMKWKERAQYDRRADNVDGWGILRFMKQDRLFDDDGCYCYVFEDDVYLRITRSAY